MEIINNEEYISLIYFTAVQYRMASTRFNYDEGRTKRTLDESTFTGRYRLNTPGPGIGLPFFEDAQVRLQKWGANLTTNTVNLESDLLGLSRSLNRDNIQKNIYQDFSAYTEAKTYGSLQPMIEESRASNPVLHVPTSLFLLPPN